MMAFYMLRPEPDRDLRQADFIHVCGQDVYLEE